MAEGAEDGDKTEDPTQKRLDEALERGDVVKSQEVNTWFVIGGATLVLANFAGGMSEGLTTLMRGLSPTRTYQMDGRRFRICFQIGVECLGPSRCRFGTDDSGLAGTSCSIGWCGR